MIRVKILIPGIDEFDAEFVDTAHLEQFRKFYTLIGLGAVTINGVNLRPKVTLEEILNSKIQSD